MTFSHVKILLCALIKIRASCGSEKTIPPQSINRGRSLMMHIVPMPGKINCKSGQRITNCFAVTMINL